MKVPKTIYLEKSDLKAWELFCEEKFKTKHVLSKIITEAMEEYLENYKELSSK